VTPFLCSPDEPPSKAAVLERALELFVRDGLAETSIRDIAAATGYTNPALYKFFESKDALALHLFERCYAHVVTELEASQRAGASFDENLEGAVEAFFRLLEAHTDAVIFVQEALRTFWRKLPTALRKRSILAIFRALLAQGQREGRVPADADVALAVGVLAGAFGQLARMAYFDELPVPWRGHAPRLARMLRGAVTTAPPPTPSRTKR
jgi:AcrR family transcriptional regulator